MVEDKIKETLMCIDGHKILGINYYIDCCIIHHSIGIRKEIIGEDTNGHIFYVQRIKNPCGCIRRNSFREITKIEGVE